MGEIENNPFDNERKFSYNRLRGFVDKLTNRGPRKGGGDIFKKDAFHASVAADEAAFLGNPKRSKNHHNLLPGA